MNRTSPAARTPAVLSLAAALLLSACTSSADIEAEAAASSSGAAVVQVDTSPEQADRASTTESDDAVALLPADVAEDGELTVGVVGTGEPPLAFLADDNATVVGSEVDVASLVAESLGLELDLRNISWEQWPLSLQSGDVEAVFSNVGVNAARLELFDFATYRQGIMAFTAATGSDLTIAGPDDVTGLRIAVGSGTNQERILLDWNAQAESDGRSPATLEYYASAADALLAVQSGRVDAYLGPNPNAVYQASKGQVEVVGTVNAGWPNTTYVAATVLKGTGLVDAVEAGLQHAFTDGSYTETLERWGLGDEAVEAPEVNPQVAG
ncbi:transporter substrate-binding domain-containing protein [Modestobacter sp. I12A-02628]|uniref:ABC transporter substrate-binding protein n=1 Tax=Goekera deserti TaxID=2497753 RepID=A0A7K3WIX2_9ACTN|nr:ABC transporter substrate-binding protein [Goekera deserti]MPQ96548.1 transporter substrate-binding domain-containing protein [Goekera deserti]NDI47139.1 transporter substrate-binding domain-containing protein [Goekera deserti]NEL55463.1 ABC transporter substrate-binding protein [Goekera deserti]